MDQSWCNRHNSDILNALSCLSSRHLQRDWRTCTKLSISYSRLIYIRGQISIVKTRWVDMGIQIFSHFQWAWTVELWLQWDLHCEHNWNWQHKWWHYDFARNRDHECKWTWHFTRHVNSLNFGGYLKGVWGNGMFKNPLLVLQTRKNLIILT